MLRSGEIGTSSSMSADRRRATIAISGRIATIVRWQTRLGLQGEFAAEIATELRATLSPREKARVETKPTENPRTLTCFT